MWLHLSHSLLPKGSINRVARESTLTKMCTSVVWLTVHPYVQDSWSMIYEQGLHENQCPQSSLFNLCMVWPPKKSIKRKKPHKQTLGISNFQDLFTTLAHSTGKLFGILFVTKIWSIKQPNWYCALKVLCTFCVLIRSKLWYNYVATGLRLTT